MSVEYQKYKNTHKRYREKHKEDRRAYALEYFYKHREECLKRQSGYRIAKRDELNQKQRENYMNNIDEKRQHNREWTRQIRRKNEENLGNVCIICGERKKKMVCHEIHAKRHSCSISYVRNHIENFVLMCSQCHDVFHHYLRHKEKFENLAKSVTVK